MLSVFYSIDFQMGRLGYFSEVCFPPGEAFGVTVRWLGLGDVQSPG